MKKVMFLLSSVMLTGMVFLSSCKKDDNTVDLTPLINFVAKAGYISGDATLTVGEQFKVNIVAFPNTSSQSKLVQFTVTRIFNNVSVVVKDTTFNLTSMNLDLIAFANPLAGPEKWYFKIVDKNGQSSEISLTITTTNAAGPINTFTQKILGGQNSNTGSSFASADGSIYKLAEAKANQVKVDWMYYYGDIDLATLAAPDDAHAATIFTNATNGLQTWTTKNATRFKLVTDFILWDAITDDAVIVEQTSSGVTQSRIPDLYAGEYLAFITASGVKGLIKIESLTTGDNGSLTISVKVQQ